MKKWLFVASRDGAYIDFETILTSDTEPDFLDVLRPGSVP